MRSPLATLLWVRHRVARHRVVGVTRESKLKVAFVSISAVLLWLAGFLICRRGLRLLDELGGTLGESTALAVSELLMGRLLSVFALALLVMLVVSNALLAYATFYRAPEMGILVTAPISPRIVFLGRFYECVFMSSWALAFVASPLLLAYGLTRDAPLSFYVALIAFYLPFVIIPAAIGAVVAMLAVGLVARWRPGRAPVVGTVALLVLAGALRGVARPPDLSDAATMRALSAAMSRGESPYLPSSWLAHGVLDAAAGRLAEAGGQLLLLIATAFVGVALATLAAERWLYPGYSAVGAAGPATRTRRWSWLDTLLRPLSPPTRELIAKDLKLFWRDPAQWSQFLLFFGILVLYVANLGDAGGIYHREPWRGWIAVLNVVACLLVLATLTTRFVFPLISLEGRRFWILDLAPVSRRWVAWQKLATSAGAISLFTVGLAALSAWRLGLDRVLTTLTIGSVALATAALAGLAVGLGSLYPSFDEESPARIVSGMGGTLAFILSLVYVALVGAALAVVVHGPRLDAFADVIPGWLVSAAGAWILGLSLLATWLPMRLGVKNLERVEL